MGHYALYLAIIIYGFLSSPTPDILSWVELIIIGLIIVSVGLVRPIHAMTGRGFPLYLQTHRVFLVYMMIVPFVVGCIEGYSISNIIRDFFPVAALILPLCFHPNKMKFFPVILMITGGVFALRYISPFIFQIDFSAGDSSLLYLANSPLVPFTAIMGFHWFTDVENSFLMKRIIGVALSIICFMAMAFMLQRAPLILSLVACIAIFSVRVVQAPVQSIIIGGIIILCMIPVWPIITEVVHSLGSKTLNVGLNNRIEELEAVMGHVSWFGIGWGGEFQSPAVADIWVRFTHNIISYYWLKAGAIGLIFSLGFIFIWGWQNIKLIRINMALGLSVLIPFMVHVTLYSGFKTLDFALLLTLITLCVQNQSLLSIEHFRQNWVRQGASHVTLPSTSADKDIK